MARTAAKKSSSPKKKTTKPGSSQPRLEAPPLKARPTIVPPPFQLKIDPKKIDDTIEELRAYVGKWVRRGFADKVRIAYKGKALAPDIPVAYFLAAQAMTFWGTGILRALIMNLGAKSLLEVSLISSAEEHYARGMERYLAGDIDAARVAFESGIASDDYHAGSQLMLGIVSKVRGDWTQARKHFLVAEKLDPTGEHGAKAKEHLRQMSRRSDEPVSSDDGE